LKGIVIAVSPIDPLVDPAEVLGAAEEAFVAAVVVVAADVVSMEKVDVIIVIFTVMTVSLHQPIQNM